MEKVCARVIVIHKGRILANASVSYLRNLMNLPWLVQISSELTEERGLKMVAVNIAAVLSLLRPPAPVKVALDAQLQYIESACLAYRPRLSCSRL